MSFALSVRPSSDLIPIELVEGLHQPVFDAIQKSIEKEEGTVFGGEGSISASSQTGCLEPEKPHRLTPFILRLDKPLLVRTCLDELDSFPFLFRV